MNALEQAEKEGAEATLAKIKESGLREYGLSREKIWCKIQRIAGTGGGRKLKIAAALDNQDMEHMLLRIAGEHPRKVLLGLGILAFLLNTEEMFFFVPEDEKGYQVKKKLEQEAEALSLKVKIKTGIVDAMDFRDSYISHVETLAALYDVVKGCWKAETLVCVKLVTAEGVRYLEPVSVPFGTRISDLLSDKGFEVKAAMIGNEMKDRDGLEKSITEDLPLGSGVIAVFDTSCCMIAEAEKELMRYREAGCGRCTFCREGLEQLYARVHDITNGKGEWDCLGMMKEIGETMRFSSCCSIGRTGAEFTLGTMKYMENEYEDHIKKKRCTKGCCPAFMNQYIDPQKCSGCGDCIPACPWNCIEGLPGYIHMIEDMDCRKCGRCMEACRDNAVVKTTGSIPHLPDRLIRAGRFKRY